MNPVLLVVESCSLCSCPPARQPADSGEGEMETEQSDFPGSELIG